MGADPRDDRTTSVVSGEVALRAASADDAAMVSHIYIESWNEGFGHLLGTRERTSAHTERWRRDLESADVEWTVASIDGRVVGFMGVGASRDPIAPDLGELHAIAVDPPHWRMGVGTALMERALAQLGHSWQRAILWTPAGYERGHAFYRATGWRPLGWARADGAEVAFHRALSR